MNTATLDHALPRNAGEPRPAAHDRDVLRGLLQPLFKVDPLLTGAGLGLLLLLPIFGALLALDPRMVMGAPVWLKPAKFALSTACLLYTSPSPRD